MTFVLHFSDSLEGQEQGETCPIEEISQSGIFRALIFFYCELKSYHAFPNTHASTHCHRHIRVHVGLHNHAKTDKEAQARGTAWRGLSSASGIDTAYSFQTAELSADAISVILGAAFSKPLYPDPQCRRWSWARRGG